MKEKTFYKTPSVKVVRLEVEKVVLKGSDEEVPGTVPGADYNPVDSKWN